MLKLPALKLLSFILIIFFVANNSQYSAQKLEEKLFYFSDSDSTKVGVKTESGKIIIPLRSSFYWGYDFKNPIKEPYLEFLGTSKIHKRSKDSPLHEAGEVYDRQGKFLYYPQWYDNHFDFFEEGFRRYVEGDKIGFVDKAGKKIKGQWDFATPFSYGYATVYTGIWKKKYDESGEHWFIVRGSQDSKSFLVNRKGEKVVPSNQKNSERDYFFENQYYPDPFIYNAFEQKIVAQLNSMSILNDINIATCSNCAPKSEWVLNFEISEYPTEFHPFYTLQGYIKQRSDSDQVFLVSKDGKDFYHQSYFGEITSLKDWITSKKAEIKEYFEDHPEKENLLKNK